MGKVKDLNIKNRTYYYFDDMINIKKFHSNRQEAVITLVTSRLKNLVTVKIFAALIPCI